MTEPSITELVSGLYKLEAQLSEHLKVAKEETARLRNAIKDQQFLISSIQAGVDLDKVELAESILYATDFSLGGDERESCRQDAIRQLTTGKSLGPYTNLWTHFFGTKSYDRWHGQRSDAQYGYGPKHGSIIFEIGLTRETRNRPQDDLSADEVEAAVYYLVNLESIQAAKAEARKKSEAAA